VFDNALWLNAYKHHHSVQNCTSITRKLPIYDDKRLETHETLPFTQANYSSDIEKVLGEDSYRNSTIHMVKA